MLCLKDPQLENDTIYPELHLMVVVIHWNKVAKVLATLIQQLTIIYWNVLV